MAMDYRSMIQARMETLREEIDGRQAEMQAIDARKETLTEEIAACQRELDHLEAAYPELAASRPTRTYSPTLPHQTSPETDREALVAFYHAVGGPIWGRKAADWMELEAMGFDQGGNDNWLSSAPIGKWYGVTVDDGGRVTALNLEANGLCGRIPPELGNLANLESLNLCGNELSSNELIGNELVGEIPTELGNLVNLRSLRLGSNKLSGGIPAELGSLTNLEELHLGSNKLSGGIPAELGNLTKLKLLWLEFNQLSGEIPADLGRLVNLKELWLDENQLSGCIPSSLRDQLDMDNMGESDLGGLPFCDE